MDPFKFAMVLTSFHNEQTCSTFAKLNDASTNDYEQCQQLGVCKDVLNSGGPFNLVTVDESEDADADCGQEPHSLVWRIALREEWFAGVDGEGERHNGLGARTNYHTLNPQPGTRLT